MQHVFVSIQTTAFSGATLLSFLLGAHPQIATIGEMTGLIPREDPNHYLCSCGQKIKECDFWRAVAVAMRQRGFDFCVEHFDTEFRLGGPRIVQYLRKSSFRTKALDSLRDTLCYNWPGTRDEIEPLIARNEALIESVLAVTGKRVFVDTSKDRLRLGLFQKYSNLDVRAVHLVRDVRGVVASRLRRHHQIDVREAARQWGRIHHRLSIKTKSWPDTRCIRIRYEDLCRDVHGTLKQLYRFCDVDLDTDITDFRAIPHHIIGNPMRLTNVSQIQLDERWRHALSEQQIRQIQKVAGRLIRQYGYG